MAWNMRLTKPMAAIAARKASIPGITAATTWRRPNPAAAATMTRDPGRLAAPASSAPADEPTARTMLNRPYVLAAPWKAVAIAVSTIGNSRPNVPIMPTRKIVHSTSGRPRT